MKHIFSLCFFLLLISCGQRSTTDSTAKTSEKPEPAKPIVNEQQNAVATEPVTTQPAATKTEEKKETGPKPTLCKFQKLEPGECLKYVFDCGSFGVEAISLPQDQADVWNALMGFEDHGDKPVAKAEFVGKTFAIFQTSMQRDVCQGGTMVKQKANTITSFKLSK